MRSKSRTPELDWICNSSMHIGRLLRKEAVISWPTLVLLKVRIKSPNLGHAQTLAAIINPTVLPVSVPPHAWRKNGSSPHGSRITLANDAARNSLPGDLSLRKFRMTFTHASRLPLDLTAPKMCLKFVSPSKTRSST